MVAASVEVSFSMQMEASVRNRNRDYSWEREVLLQTRNIHHAAGYFLQQSVINLANVVAPISSYYHKAELESHRNSAGNLEQRRCILFLLLLLKRGNVFLSDVSRFFPSGSLFVLRSICPTFCPRLDSKSRLIFVGLYSDWNYFLSGIS